MDSAWKAEENIVLKSSSDKFQSSPYLSYCIVWSFHDNKMVEYENIPRGVYSAAVNLTYGDVELICLGQARQ